jgi:hypothetical protein
MNQHRNLATGENLDHLVVEDERGNAPCEAMTMRATFRPRSIDDRLVGMFILNLDRLAYDAGSTFHQNPELKAVSSSARK